MKPGLKRFFIHFSIITGILIAIFFLSQWCLTQFTRHGQALSVPDFVGMSVAEANSVASEHFFQLEIIDSLFLPNQTRGTVFRQIPEAGGMVKKNRRILITINSVLPRKVNAPSLVGYSLRQAKAELTSQNFRLGTLYYETDFATNSVLQQLHHNNVLLPGTLIDSHSVIDLVLGVHPDNDATYVPNVVGLNLESAKDVLSDHYLNIGLIRFDSTVQSTEDSLAAIVVRQDPESSNFSVYPMGRQINLFLSLLMKEAEKEERR